jgi:uncharacterized membrane protein AbrB (regulator of aidB expression)
MTAKEILDIVRGAIRPYLAFIFPTAVVIIGAIVAFKLLPEAVKFIDRDIGLVIIVTVLTIVTAIVTAATTIMAFYFGERAGKKKEEK